MLTMKIRQNISENNRLSKIFTTSIDKTLTYTFKNSVSLFSPTIIVSTDIDLSKYNYVELVDFSRKYFVNEINIIRNGLYEIKLSEDVLSTYESEIRKMKAVVRRQENIYNLYLDDPDFRTYNYEQIVTKKFPNSFDKDLQFILTVAGGVSNG